MMCFEFRLVQGFAGKKTGSCLPSKPPCLLLHFSGHFFLTTLKETKSLAFQQGVLRGSRTFKLMWWPFKKNHLCLPFPYQIQTPIWNLDPGCCLAISQFFSGENKLGQRGPKRTSHDKWPPCCLDLQTPKTSGQLGQGTGNVLKMVR